MYVTFPYICGFWEIEIWNFSQSESITDHSSHTEFTMEQESLNVEDHPRSISAKLVPFIPFVYETKTEMWKVN